MGVIESFAYVKNNTHNVKFDILKLGIMIKEFGGNEEERRFELLMEGGQRGSFDLKLDAPN